MKKSNLRFLFLFLIIADVAFSFVQHYHKALDGDVANIVFQYKEVMSDPFGLSVLFENKTYGGTNRFFVHWMMSSYFKHVPLWLQHFVNPIDSIYLSCALIKTLSQVLILWVLASFISGTRNILNHKFLLAAILIEPLFQTAGGYNRYMGVICSSITYAFFYSIPLALVLLFFLPFQKRIVRGAWSQLSIVKIILLMLFAVVLALGGPLSPAIMLIGFTLILFSVWKKHFNEGSSLSPLENIFTSIKKIPRQLMLLSVFVFLLCLYSVYLGQFNIENTFHSVPPLQRYAALPIGLYYSFTQKLGLPLLTFMILLNLFLISRVAQTEMRRKIFSQAKWISVFVLIYIFILPLGGYRDYRPNIVRGDTLLPMIVSMIYVFGLSAFHLFAELQSKFKLAYTGVVLIFLSVFMIADKSLAVENECEKNAIKKISESPEKIVEVSSDCFVISWYKITNYNESGGNTQLLKLWGVTKEDKFYYQK